MNLRRIIQQFSSRLGAPRGSVLRMGGKKKGKLEKLNCNYCHHSGHLCKHCKAHNQDESLGFYLPQRDAPWRAVMEEKIQAWIDKAVQIALSKLKKKHGKEEAEFHLMNKDDDDANPLKEPLDDGDYNFIKRAYDELDDDSDDGFSFYTLFENHFLSHSSSRFILDSGASAHVTGNFSLLRNPQKCSQNFNTGNSENPITSTHIGCIEFKSTTNKSTITIENVYYCSQTSVNVLSLQSLLLNLEASAKFKDKECVLLRGGKKLMVATLESDHLYAVSSHTPDEFDDNKILSLSYSRNINY